MGNGGSWGLRGELCRVFVGFEGLPVHKKRGGRVFPLNNRTQTHAHARVWDRVAGPSLT